MTVHSVDPAALGQWWADVLGRVVVHASDDEFEIRPEPDRLPGLAAPRCAPRSPATASPAWPAAPGPAVDRALATGRRTRDPARTAHGGQTPRGVRVRRRGVKT
ncbi:hypothetical protein GCM10020295_08230 [Streptomyces cinereospinus]